MKDEFKTLSTQEKIDTRENLIKRMREVHETAKSESRDLTAEEQSKFNAMSEDARELTVAISEEKRNDLLNGFSTELPKEESREEPSKNGMEEFRAFLNNAAKRNLTIDGSNAPAAAIAPAEFVNELQKDLEKETQLIGKVRKVMVSKISELEIPYETAEISDASWTTETGAIGTDTQQRFESRKIGLDKTGKEVVLSEKTILASALNIEAIVKEELGYKMRCVLENAIINGSGSGQPLGILTASASGISTARDYVAANETTLTGDDIIKAKRKVPAAYRSSGVWVFHPDVVTELLTLKDNNGQYIWRSGLLPGDPDILDGSPIIESEFMPATLVADGYAGLFGDFSKYWLAMYRDILIEQITDTNYKKQGLVGFLASVWAGGAPINEKAFARIAMASES